ncbi:hypothetical protein GEV33_004474 [Tenebrio molitor]|uniref:DUF5641 domain-containing protein n=1 Tax=Tenebrio molitor TaxID=7067 RepID=A0A8J6LGB2_TENMO|nr:hypothetical protein GEV33_004474 [Tenebrio molitor]
MYTFLTLIEACLNSRPLTALSNDPSDHSFLTPGHFLIGESLTAPVEPDLSEMKINRLSRWQLVTRLKQHFWKRWSREYLGQLQQRNKWATSSAQKINIGSLVILIEDNTPPLKWPLGRVVKLHPGKDGITRVVTIQTQGASTVKRAVQKLCVLPVDTITVECRKREKQLPSREKSRSCKWRTSLHNFSRKARVKTQAFFFISSLSLFIFVLPSNTVFVPRTPKRRIRDPTGVTAGSLRRASYNAPRRRSPHRQSSPSPESRSPASGSDQHRSNYGQTFLTLSKPALTWYRSVRDGIGDWQSLVKLLKKNFFPPDYDERLLGEIKSRYQTCDESPTIYVALMNNMFTRLSKTPPEIDRLKIIRRNLCPHYISALALENITSIDRLIELCQKIDDAYEAKKRIPSAVKNRNPQLHVAEITATSGSKGDKYPAALQAFDILKKALVSAPILSSPDFSLPFTIQCDASGYGIGAALTQIQDGAEHVIACASRTLSKTETIASGKGKC